MPRAREDPGAGVAMGVMPAASESPMKVALLLPFAPGILRFRGPLLRALRDAGHDATVLSPDPGPTILAALGALGVAWRGVPIARAGIDPFSDLAAIAAVRSVLQELRPDLFLGFNPKGVMHGTLAAAAANVPRRFAMVTGLGHAFTAPGPRAALARFASVRLLRRALPRLHGLLVQNPDDLDTLRSLRLLPTDLPVTLLPGTGVDVEHFAPAPLPNEPAFLMAARLLSTKGVREYAAAAERLRADGNAAPCRLAGWIDRTPAAIGQRELDRWCARGAIEFLGRLEDVRPAIAAASVCVLPSHREGLPLFLLEAMAMGRAVIATAVPGCREAVDPGVTGLLVPPRDSAALGEAMATLAADPARVAAMGAAGRRRVLERFESRAVCIRLLAAIGLGGTASTIAPPCDP